MRSCLVIAVALAGCVSTATRIDGSVEAEAAEFDAEWQMSPDACYSGQRISFFGVDLTQDGDPGTRVRILYDALDGYFIAASIPGADETIQVSPDVCETFDVEVARGDSEYEKIWNLEGHALADCVLPEFTLHIDVNFSNCH